MTRASTLGTLTTRLRLTRRGLVISLGAAEHKAAVVSQLEGELLVQASAGVPASDDLAGDLRALVAALGGKPPRDAVVVLEEATTLCLELPPSDGLPEDRLEGMVRWELEPYLSGDGGAVCAWASSRAGDAPLFAAGIPAAERARIVSACAAAGLRARKLLAPTGLGAALAPEEAVVLDVHPRGVDLVRVQDSAIVAVRRVACAEAALPAQVTELVEDGVPTVLLGAPSESVRAVLAADGALDLDPPNAPFPARLRAAGTVALGLAGGERLAPIPARDPSPPLRSRPPAVVAVLAAACLLLVGGSEAVFARLRRTAGERAQTLETQASRLRQAAADQAALKTRQTTLEGERARVRSLQAVHDAARARQALLPALLSDLTHALPADVAVDSLEEQGEGVLTIEGFALSELAVQQLLRDLSVRLAERGYAPRDPVVRRRRGRLGVHGYGFTLRYEAARKESS